MSKEWESIINLYRTEFQKLYRVAYRMIKNEETARDLVQDTFTLAVFHQADISKHPKPEAWLMSTLVNQAKNEQRQQRRHMEIPLEELLDLPAPDPSQPLESTLPTGLTEDDKSILVMRFERQMAYSEISKELGITEGSCRSRISRAVAKCRKLFDQYGP